MDKRNFLVSSEKKSMELNDTFTLIDLHEFEDEDEVIQKYILIRNPHKISMKTDVEEFSFEVIS